MIIYKAKCENSDDEIIGFLAPMTCILQGGGIDPIKKTITWGIVPIDNTFFKFPIYCGNGISTFKMPLINIDISTLKEIEIENIKEFME